MKTTIIEIKAPYQGFGYITIPKGTKVTMQSRNDYNGDTYHEVIDIRRLMKNTSGMTAEQKYDFQKSIIYHPVRVPAKFVQ